MTEADVRTFEAEIDMEEMYKQAVELKAAFEKCAEQIDRALARAASGHAGDVYGGRATPRAQRSHAQPCPELKP